MRIKDDGPRIRAEVGLVCVVDVDEENLRQRLSRDDVNAPGVLGQDELPIGTEAKVCDIGTQRQRQLLLRNQAWKILLFDDRAGLNDLRLPSLKSGEIRSRTRLDAPGRQRRHVLPYLA